MKAGDGPPTLYWVDRMRFLLVKNDYSVSMFSVVAPARPSGIETREMVHGWDLIVTGVNRGSEVRVGSTWYPIEPGKTLMIPRQTPHAFRHERKERGHFYVASRPGGLEMYLEQIGHKEIVYESSHANLEIPPEERSEFDEKNAVMLGEEEQPGSGLPEGDQREQTY